MCPSLPKWRGRVFLYASRWVLLAFSSFLFGALPSVAQTQSDLAQIESQVRAQKAESDKLEKKEHMTTAELDALRQKLIDATSTLQAKQREQDDLEDRLDELEHEQSEKAE